MWHCADKLKGFRSYQINSIFSMVAPLQIRVTFNLLTYFMNKHYATKSNQRISWIQFKYLIVSISIGTWAFRRAAHFASFLIQEQEKNIHENFVPLKFFFIMDSFSCAALSEEGNLQKRLKTKLIYILCSLWIRKLVYKLKFRFWISSERRSGSGKGVHFN